MRNAGIIHYALFRNGNNSLQCAYFVNNGLQSASMNKRFLNIIHKMVQILQQFISRFRVSTRGDVETCEPQIRGLSVNSIADSLSLNFLVYFAKMPSYFLMKTNKRKVRKCLKCLKVITKNKKSRKRKTNVL